MKRIHREAAEEGRKPRRIIFLRRGAIVGIVTGLAAVAIFCTVLLFPASTAVSSTTRQLPIYSVETAAKRCAISFDAAWGNEDTQQLIDILGRYNVKATFFLVGDWVDRYPESVAQLHTAGMEIMNHSNDHAHYNSLSGEEIIADVTACNDKIAAITGITPTLIRCPYGEYDDHVIAAIRSMGMEPIQWDVEHSARGANPLAERVLGGMMLTKKPEWFGENVEIYAIFTTATYRKLCIGTKHC